MKTRIMILAVLFVCASVAPAFAAVKMAYVDLSQAFDQYEKTRTYDDKLSEVQTEKEKDLEQVANEIKGLEDKMSLLSEKEKAAKLLANDGEAALAYLTGLSAKACHEATDAYWKLGDLLWTKYDEKW